MSLSTILVAFSLSWIYCYLYITADDKTSVHSINKELYLSTAGIWYFIGILWVTRYPIH